MAWLLDYIDQRTCGIIGIGVGFGLIWFAPGDPAEFAISPKAVGISLTIGAGIGAGIGAIARWIKPPKNNDSPKEE